MGAVGQKPTLSEAGPLTQYSLLDNAISAGDEEYKKDKVPFPTQLPISQNLM